MQAAQFESCSCCLSFLSITAVGGLVLSRRAVSVGFEESAVVEATSRYRLIRPDSGEFGHKIALVPKRRSLTQDPVPSGKWGSIPPFGIHLWSAVPNEGSCGFHAHSCRSSTGATAAPKSSLTPVREGER